MILVGKSEKGKDRVQQFGKEWRILDIKDTVSFTSEKGPWILAQSEKDPRRVVWVHEDNDKDFIIEGPHD